MFGKFKRCLLTFAASCGIMLFVVRGCEAPEPIKQFPSVPVRVLKLKDFRPPKQVNAAKETSTVPYVPAEGSVTITPKDRTKTLADVVQISIKDKGLTFRPGVQYGLPDRVGLDAKLAFYKRFGLGCGVNSSLHVFDPRLSLWGSYKLDRIRFIQNTEVFVGLDHTQQIQIGLRINL